MRNVIKHILLLSMLAGVATSCVNVAPLDLDDVGQASLLERDMKKWAEERDLQKAQDESDQAFLARVKKQYDLYYQAIRDYKKSDHKIVYGWFSGWTATEGVDRSFLTNVPDSVDIVALWGGIGAFDENDPRYEDLRIAQQVKGLKVVLCWQTSDSGLGLEGKIAGFNERNPGLNSVEKARAYAKELTAFIKKHNLNGYDIDWEPTVGNHGGGCHNLYQNCEDWTQNSLPIRTFIEEMGKTFGPKQTEEYDPRGTGTLFLFDGQIEHMSRNFGDLGDYFNYFVNQNYDTIGPNHEVTSYVVNSIKGWDWKKYIQADEFEKNAADAGVCGKDGDKLCAYRKAENVVAKDYGGWAAYHIELDKDYIHTKKVIQIMNPSSFYSPDNNTINKLLDVK